MITTKLLEVRDAGTFIPVLCINVANAGNDAQHYLLRRCGYPLDGRPNIILTPLDAGGKPAWNDPYGWKGARTFPVAHEWIIDHWEMLKDGAVVDVEYILGESSVPKTSERLLDF
ncbi:MAG: hypothetical protein FWD08_00225 [Alphaproteobacteria bacterium]|nr:hypothetical protein [Alphaproteobacteria bacterium]